MVFLGKLNPFRKETTDKAGNKVVTKRRTGEVIKTVSKDKAGNKIKVKGDKTKIRKKGNVIGRSNVVKKGDMVTRTKGVKVTDGKMVDAPGYKMKVKKKKDGIQVKEKGVDIGTGKKGKRKTRIDSSGNISSIREKSMSSVPGFGYNKVTEDSSTSDLGKVNLKTGKNITTTKNTNETKKNDINVSTTKDNTNKDTNTNTNTNKDTKKDTKVTYGSKRSEYAGKNIKDAKFVDKGGKKNLRTYKQAWTDSAETQKKYKDKGGYKAFKKDAEAWWKQKGLSKGGERRLGGAITGQAKFGGSMGPQGIL